MKNPTLLKQMALAVALVLTFLATTAQAQNGTWINAAGGTWSDPLNWLNGVVAKGPGSTADFSTLDVPAGTTITVTADIDPVTSLPFVIGNLLFGDTDATNGVGNWILADGGGGLTLESTTSSNSIIQVNLAQGSVSNLVTGWGTLTISAVLNGTNTLVKTGPNRLILNPATANGYTGGTIISNGMVELGVANAAGTANATSLGTGPIIFRGGALREQNAAIPGNNPGNGGNGVSALSLPVIVETGQVGTLYLSCRAFPAFNGTVTGAGTFNVVVDFVRDNLDGDWSGFTGQLNIIPSTRQATEDFRFGTGFVPGGLANARVHLTSNVLNNSTLAWYNNGSNGPVIVMGELSCVLPNFVNLLANNTGAGAGNSLPFVLQVGRLNTTATFSGNFSAPGAANGVGIIKEGTGDWILTGQTIENNGMMVVSNGVLQIGSGTSGKLGRTPVVTNYATLAFGRSDTLVVTNVIEGPGVLEQRGAGTLILAPTSGANTYTGKTVVTNGLLLAVPETALGPNPASPVADQLTLNGGGLRSTNNLNFGTANRGITLGSGGGKLTPDTNTILTISSVIAGSGSLTINGAGTAGLTAANTYSGKTILKTGVLSIGSETALGANPASFTADQLTFDGGALEPVVNFSLSIAANNRGITVGAGGGDLRVQTGTQLTLGTPMAGSGTLMKTGGGTVILNASGNYSGTLAVNQGTLAIGASGALPGTAKVNLASGATLDVSAAGLTVASGQSITGNGTVAGNLTAGAGSILSAGASVGILALGGNLILNGATNLVEISSTTNDLITVSGNLTLSGVSTINLLPLSGLPAGTYPLIKYGGTLSGGLGNLSLAGFPASRLSGNLAINATTKTIDLVVTGSSSALVWTGGQAANAWDVNTTANWLLNGTPDKFFDGDSVSFTEVGSTNPSVNLVAPVSTTASVNSTTDYTFGGPGKLTGLTSLTKAGSGKLTILATNDYNGTTTISAGTLQVGNGVASGSLGAGGIIDNASLLFNLPGSGTVSSPISGTGSVTIQAGTVILNGTNSYGTTTINSGATLQVGTGSASGSLGTGGVTDNGALVFQRSGVLTNASPISGSGSLTVKSGTVVLAVNNSYAGATLVDTGTLQIGAGGTSGSLGSANSIALTNGGTLRFNRSDNLTNLVSISGVDGTLAQAGPGTLVVANDDNNFGTTVVSGGKLQVGDGVNPSGRIGSGPVIVTNTGMLVFNRPDEVSFTNKVVGNGSMGHVGQTNLVIGTPDGANTYSGGTTLSNAILALTNVLGNEVGAQTVNSGGLGTGPLNFLGNSTLQFTAANQTDPFGNGSGNFANPIVVPVGQTGTVQLPGRFTLSGAISGAGTLNLAVNYVRGNISANWTNFSGTLNVISNSVNPNNVAHDFRLFNTSGFPNAKVHLGDGTTTYNRGTAGATIPVGELSSEPTALLGGTGGAEGGNNVTWQVGGLNTDATFAGTAGGSVNVSFVKVGTGKWTWTGTHNNTGTGSSITVSNGILALGPNATTLVDGSLGAVPSIATASPGILDVTALTDGTLHVGETGIQTNRGTGTVRGKLLVGASGILAPGFSIGTLTITSNVTVVGTLELEINTTNSPTSDLLVAPAIAADESLGTATLTVNNLGDEPAAWTQFKLTSVPVTGAFVTTNLPVLSNPDLYWSNRLSVDGTLVVASLTIPPPTSSTTPTNIVFAKVGNTLDLSWPASHIGWQLRVQTNNLAQGVSTNLADWSPVANSSTTNRVSVPIDTARPAQFYRLVLP